MLTRGDVLGGRYRLDEPIATGGMGEVWRATDVNLSRTVALKVLRTALVADPAFDARFRAEARTMAALSHPNVVNLYDYGRSPVPAGEATYLVMGYVDGQPLSDRLAALGALPAGETLAILAQTADALNAAHARGIVHRDVKPANLLVRPDGTVVLVDFGVARSPALTSATTGNQVLGTALYMAPEQASGQGVSPAADIYALGVVGYHCLAGHPPFAGESAVEVALRQVSEEPPPLPSSVPPAARAVVMRAMAKNPADRFPDAAAFAAAARAATTAPAGPATEAMSMPGAPGLAAPVPLAAPALARAGAAGGAAVAGRAGSHPATLTDLPPVGTAPVYPPPAVGGAAARPAGWVAPGPDEAAARDGRRRRFAALTGVLAMVVLLGILGVLVLHGARSGGTVPTDRPPTGHPASPGTGEQPTPTRGQPSTGPATPSVTGTPSAPATTPPAANPPPAPSAPATTGGATGRPSPSGPGTGGSADPAPTAPSPPASGAATSGTAATAAPSVGAVPGGSGTGSGSGSGTGSGSGSGTASASGSDSNSASSSGNSPSRSR